ncbi:hypothetical protein SAMN05660380_01320 [Xylella fastidiosa]|jgi:hypothetical protein|nr:hypothetical protein SAMN05660380_01320 [Xylella fastidiosa]
MVFWRDCVLVRLVKCPHGFSTVVVMSTNDDEEQSPVLVSGLRAGTLIDCGVSA